MHRVHSSYDSMKDFVLHINTIMSENITFIKRYHLEDTRVYDIKEGRVDDDEDDNTRIMFESRRPERISYNRYRLNDDGPLYDSDNDSDIEYEVPEPPLNEKDIERNKKATWATFKKFILNESTNTDKLFAVTYINDKNIIVYSNKYVFNVEFDTRDDAILANIIRLDKILHLKYIDNVKRELKKVVRSIDTTRYLSRWEKEDILKTSEDLKYKIFNLMRFESILTRRH